MAHFKTLEPIDFYDIARGGNAPLSAPQERQLVAIELARSVIGDIGGRLLDVGCGDGLFLAAIDRELALSQRGWQLCGLDYSRSMLEQARTRPYRFDQGNLEEGLPYEDATFDLIAAGEVLEHLYDPDRLLAEAHRALRPGGSLLITTPNLQAWYNRVLFAFGVQPLYYETSTKSASIGAGPLRRIRKGAVPVGHVRVFNRRALLDLLDSQGFRVTAVRGARFEAVPARSVDRMFNLWPGLASNLVVLATRR